MPYLCKKGKRKKRFPFWGEICSKNYRIKFFIRLLFGGIGNLRIRWPVISVISCSFQYIWYLPVTNTKTIDHGYFYFNFLPFPLRKPLFHWHRRSDSESAINWSFIPVFIIWLWLIFVKIQFIFPLNFAVFDQTHCPPIRIVRQSTVFGAVIYLRFHLQRTIQRQRRRQIPNGIA